MVHERYDGPSHLYFPDFGEENTPLEEQEVDDAKNLVCSKQHILLFAKMQIHFAQRAS